MPYTRYVDNGRSVNSDYVPVLRSMIDKVYNGDAISVTKTNEGKDIIGYVSEQHKHNNYSRPLNNSDSVIDETTQYTYRFGYQNGHPCMFITFTNILPELADTAILCLELENFAKSKYGKCQAINVFESRNNTCTLNMMNHHITWYYMHEIEVGVEYCIYIVAASYAWRHHIYKWSLTKKHDGDTTVDSFPNDWEVRLKIRPTIRNYDGKQYCYFQRSLKDFTWVKYPLLAEYGR